MIRCFIIFNLHDWIILNIIFNKMSKKLKLVGAKQFTLSNKHQQNIAKKFPKFNAPSKMKIQLANKLKETIFD